MYLNREINYIFAPDGLAAIYEYKNTTGKMYYVATDNLGSINLLVNQDGSVASDLKGVYPDYFIGNACGRRRNPTNWSYNNITLSTITDRGYTMHACPPFWREHMDNFSLINMNGRVGVYPVYFNGNPKLGQFLSPDPFVQSPSFTQSYNRYVYCMNNPLKYTDPSGYISWNDWRSTHPEGSRSEYLEDYAMNWSQEQITDFFGSGFGAQGATYASGEKQDFQKMLAETAALWVKNHTSKPSYLDEFKGTGGIWLMEVPISAVRSITWWEVQLHLNKLGWDAKKTAKTEDPYRILYGNDYQINANGEKVSYGPVTQLSDYFAVSGSANFYNGGGSSQSFNLGMLDDNQVFPSTTNNQGAGWDRGVSLYLSWGNYYGDGSADRNKLMEAGVFQNINIGLVTVSLWQDISTDGSKLLVGRNWRGFSIGLTFPPGLGGSFGSSYTAPLYNK